jgi:hypothetical protein
LQWHVTNTYRRVVHLTYSHGDTDSWRSSEPRLDPETHAALGGSQAWEADPWLRYLLRKPSDVLALPPAAGQGEGEDGARMEARL